VTDDVAASSPPVGVVTGGGGGIGAAIAEELARQGWFVVTVDPLVSLDGSEQIEAPEETTVDRIVAAGGAARASDVSVTDGDAIAGLFHGLVDEFGRLDAVINVAGISRPTSFAKGHAEDWQAVLSVHLDGYLNVLSGVLPIMADAGTGHILGITSGSGWRQADAGAYGCAKRAVASLTWQLGRAVPPGVVVNALSPIAVTRMVTAALGRTGADQKGGGAGSRTGGLSLGAMPTPDQLGPLAAHLVSDEFDWCRGRVLFAGGSEVAMIDEPRLIEVVRTDDAVSLPHVLDVTTSGALVPAEAAQSTTGGSNARGGPIFDEVGQGATAAEEGACAVIVDRAELVTEVVDAFASRSVTCTVVAVDEVEAGFDGAAAALAAAVEQGGPLDAVVVATAGHPAGAGGPAAWQRVLAEHAGLPGQLFADARWARVVADYAVAADRPVRLVMLIDAVEAGGRSRAQACAQLARAARRATDDHVTAFAVSIETVDERDIEMLGEIAAHLSCSPSALDLSGAELVAGRGWFGLRSHPRPRGSITFGGPDLPDWFDDALRAIVEPATAGGEPS
jgi:NAD(P)-dependent dehydrogenase (short-subunit alcohol dehydrogenase family)